MDSLTSVKDPGVAVEQSVAVFFRPIPLEQIRPSAHQARKNFDEASLQGLAESLKQEGLIQPVTVRRLSGAGNTDGARFELISGERRFRAAQLLGWKTIEARLLEGVSEGEAAAKSLIENLQREDLNPIEEAEGFATLNAVDPGYWTQERIALVSGKSRPYVTQSLGLTTLPRAIQDDVRQRHYSRGHALELSRLPTADLQLHVSRQIPGKLTREKTRAMVDHLLGPERLAKRSPVVKSQSLKDIDVLKELWPDFVRNPWLGPAGTVHVHHNGDQRWSFDISIPTVDAASDAELRNRLRQELGQVLTRIGRSLSFDTRPPTGSDPSATR